MAAAGATIACSAIVGQCLGAGRPDQADAAIRRGDESLYGEADNDTINGGDGDDSMIWNGGDDDDLFQINGAISGTGIASDGLTSEALSKTVFVLGPAGGLELLETIPGVDAVIIDPQADLLRPLEDALHLLGQRRQGLRPHAVAGRTRGGRLALCPRAPVAPGDVALLGLAHVVDRALQLITGEKSSFKRTPKVRATSCTSWATARWWCGAASSAAPSTARAS